MISEMETVESLGGRGHALLVDVIQRKEKGNSITHTLDFRKTDFNKLTLGEILWTEILKGKTAHIGWEFKSEN